MSESSELEFEKYAVGQSVTRTEDPRLLRGDGRYTDDINLAGQAYAYMFRSPYAHGRIQVLDVTPAREMPGVIMVVTAQDLNDAGVSPLPCGLPVKNRDGSDMRKPPRPSLAEGTVRFRGEACALVVAESHAQARDAAEAIILEVADLPAVTDAREALHPSAPCLHVEAPGNLALDWEFGPTDTVNAAFKGAHHVESLGLVSNRVVVNAMEPRAAVVQYDAASDRYTMHGPSQGAFGLRNGLAGAVMGIEKEKLRVLTGDVGGSFGMKGSPYPEHAPMLVASKCLGRPVKWCDERVDSFVSDQHGRDSFAEVSIAFDKDGAMLAAKAKCNANVGAYLTAVGPSMHTRNLPRNFPGGYRLPLFSARTRAAFTNTTPIGAYRGAGRPEGVYYMERLLDNAARHMGIDRVELRRRNLLRPDELPFEAVSELTYDSGDFPALLDTGIEQSEWAQFEQRREQSKANGKLRGLGLACYLEVTGPPATEMGGIRFRADGRVTMVSGSLNYGQGHAATFAQIVTTQLGIPFDRLDLLQGDSDELIAGAGTGGSRTVISAGALLLQAGEAVIENGRRVAGHVLESAVEDIEFSAGQFRVAGTDRSVDIMTLAQTSRTLDGADGTIPASMDAEVSGPTPPSAFPNGCHVAEVEIDPDTGAIALARYHVVDDFGTLINPMLVEGQVHGGVAQGVGQALMEYTAYDSGGQLLTGSYMDYTLPRAEDMPAIGFGSRPVPAKTNPLGAKGCGEAGTTGALPAVMNAVVDALHRAVGVEHIDMPVTSEKVWRALHQ
ncbi:MAG: xanthine dehydrogenase family protein molybdopterin-binding subunit [Chromatiales bacterium]|jgi:aerobic carbon-monoxide dehydrogenase large subunit|nr:xanthine dehydrogenase family protein molybdopterin-binding subunit [Chromatiales bacterium]